MTRNEELALAFETAAKAANPNQAMGSQQPLNDQRVQYGALSNIDLQAHREAIIVSRVLTAIARVYREAAKAETPTGGPADG